MQKPQFVVRNAWFRTFIAWILGTAVVALIDHDGAVNIRLARKDALGRWYACRHQFHIRDVLFDELGNILNGSYVTKAFVVRDFRS